MLISFKVYFYRNNMKNVIGFYGKDDNLTVKNFDSLDEFRQYYDLHADEIDNLSTFKLNRMFHIKNYKITRRNLDGGPEGDKKLCFRQLFKNELTPKMTEEPKNDVNDRIKALENDVLNLKQQVIEIINVLNSVQ